MTTEATIRAEYEAGSSLTSLGTKYGISRRQVSRIVDDIRRPDVRPRPGKSTRQHIHQCAVCLLLFHDRRPRTYCSDACRQRSTYLAFKQRFAEFEWIALTDSWDNIAGRLNFKSCEHMRDWLRKHGESQWAERISTDVERPRQGRWAA